MKRTKPGPLEADEADRLADLFKALGDPSRLALIDQLAREELCVHDLAARVGMEQSAVSHQLRLMRDRGLLERRRDGRHIYYALADGHVRDIFEFALEHAREDR